MSKVTIFVIAPKQFTSDTINDVTLKTYPSKGDFVVGTFEVERVPPGTTIYNPHLTAYEPFVQPGEIPEASHE